MTNSTSTDPDTDLLMRYFHEIPNKDAAIAATALYAAVTLVMLYLTIRTRAWFMMTVVVTGVAEAVGFAARASMISHPTSNTYIIMQCCLIISPVLLAVTEYMCVGRLMLRSEAGRTFTLAKWLAKLYTLSDILCLALQGAGGGASASTDQGTRDNGLRLLQIGLYLQLFFFTTFTIVTIYTHVSPKFELRGDTKLRPIFICLYITIALMFVRNIFRVVEFLQGFDGYLATHETFLYIFDFTPIYACFLFFSFFHYGFYLGPSNPGQKPMTEWVDGSTGLPVAAHAENQGQQQQHQQPQQHQHQHRGLEMV